MGWGFAIIVDKKSRDGAMDVLEGAGVHAEQIGLVNDSGKITIRYRDKHFVLR